MNTVQGDEHGAVEAFDLGIEAGLSIARFGDALTAQLSATPDAEQTAAERFAAAAETALARHRERYRAWARRAARATQLDEPRRTLAYATLAADLTHTR